MATINHHLPAPHVALEIDRPSTSAPQEIQNSAPRRSSIETSPSRPVPASGPPRLASRNAPFPRDHCAIDMPLPPDAPGSSRNVAFRTKLAATMKAGIGTTAPIAAIDVSVDLAVNAAFRAAQHVAQAPGADIATKATAVAINLAAEAALTTAVAVVGHTYLDEKFYHSKDKTANEMLATKKANSAIFAYVGGAGASFATTMAATALTGGAVTASVVKTALITQAITSVIVPPLVVGATAIVYKARKGSERSDDSLQAGLESYGNWAYEKLQSRVANSSQGAATSHRPEGPVIASGDDMV
jgi:hypothetical protein